MAWDTNLDPDSSAYKFAACNSQIVRVVAGPGTGKSYGLQRKIERLLEEGQDPKKILAVTFTRAAAQDLKHAISSCGVKGADQVITKTLHSFCFGLLQKKDIMDKIDRTPRPMLSFEQKPMLCDLDGTTGTIKDKLEKIKAFEAAWARLQDDEVGKPANNADRKFRDQLLEWLKKHKAMLFGEMIFEAYQYLKDNPECYERHQFDHILVDEFQDLNKADQSVIDLLASNCKLAIIGDDDQSIYSFRCAHPEGIRDFPSSHQGCNTISFDYCWRCPKSVVRMASCLISHNPNRTLGELQEHPKNQNGDVHIIQWRSLEEEINGICNIVIKNVGKEIIKPEDVLILVPINEIGDRVRKKLIEAGINTRSGSHKLKLDKVISQRNYELLMLLANPDDMVALRYLLGSGDPHYRSNSYKHLLNYATDNHTTITEILDRILSGDIKIPYTNSLVKTYEKIREEIQDLKKAAELSDDDFINILAPDIPECAEFRAVLMDAIQANDVDKNLDPDGWFQSIRSFMIENELNPDDASENNYAKVLTFHASKGLSAKYVIVMSAIDELIPRIDAIDSIIEEQRRLFYVAITRCKSSKADYPGTLIISSFSALPFSDAKQFGIPAKTYGPYSSCATRFMREFEGTAPAPVSGTNYLNSL